MPALQATCVAIDSRAILIQGAPGSGKSSLALALIDRGALLVGDDGVMIERSGNRLLARPHPNTRGLIEVRNLGLITMPACAEATVALVIRLDEKAPRYREAADEVLIEAVPLPLIGLDPTGPVLALKAEIALSRFGIAP